MGATERRIRIHTRNALCNQAHQHQVILCAAGHDLVTAFNQRIRHYLGIATYPPLILRERGFGGLFECDSLGGDYVLERPALRTREHERIEFFRKLVVLASQNQPATRATQRLVRRRCHDVGNRNRVRVMAGHYESRDMGHVNHQVGADAVCNITESLPVDHL